MYQVHKTSKILLSALKVPVILDFIQVDFCWTSERNRSKEMLLALLTLLNVHLNGTLLDVYTKIKSIVYFGL